MEVLAVPLFGDEVAPRFCAADEVLVVEIGEGGAAEKARRLSLKGLPWSTRLDRVAAEGVTILLCCGFNRRFLARAESLGMRVIWGLAGTASELVTAHLSGDLEQHLLGRTRPCGDARPCGGGPGRGGLRRRRSGPHRS